VHKVQICQQLNRWPFPNPPETMTLAQMLFYDEALRQLTEALDDGQPARKSKKLTGAAKAALYAKAAGTDGNQ
jgi:hypothetical protein